MIYGSIAAGFECLAMLLITLSEEESDAAELAAIQESQAGQEEVSLEDLIRGEGTTDYPIRMKRS